MSTPSRVETRYRIGFIGAGVMGQAVIETLLKAGVSPDQISFTRKRSELNEEISARYSITAKSLHDLVQSCDLIFLAVKPQNLNELLEEIKATLPADVIVVSLLAAKKTSVIQAGLLNENPVIRVMPNTPMVLGEGVSAISPSANVDPKDLEWLTTVLSFGGRALVIDEGLQDAVTTITGSGPAYFFAFVEAMVESGVKLGIDEKEATELAIATIKGAAAMLDRSGKTATTLRENVTSPNGVTFAALNLFKERGLNEMVEAAMKAAHDRSVELG